MLLIIIGNGLLIFTALLLIMIVFYVFFIYNKIGSRYIGILETTTSRSAKLGRNSDKILDTLPLVNGNFDKDYIARYGKSLLEYGDIGIN